MTSEQIDITVGISLIIKDIINEILYVRKTTPDGREYIADRELPFRLRYRLNKNRLVFEKDAQEFHNMRMIALAKYGEATPDGQNVEITDPEKMEMFRQEVSNILDSPVTHSIVKLEPEDIELVSDTDINISPDAMGIFIGYMTNDPELQKDLNTHINVVVNPSQKNKTEETPVEAPVEEVTPEVESTPVVEDPKVEVKVEEAPAPAKKPRTKTQKKLQNIAEKKPVLDGIEEVKTKETPKKTTTRKPRTKKVVEETANG